MGKIVEVIVELDDEVPEFMAGTIRCGSVRSYDANGKLCVDYQDLIDNTIYHSEAELIEDVSRRLKFHSSIISISQ
jgi:tRNA isopentenyl-2-thiomethyl-A-37 hydroxylase MiaE